MPSFGYSQFFPGEDLGTPFYVTGGYFHTPSPDTQVITAKGCFLVRCVEPYFIWGIPTLSALEWTERAVEIADSRTLLY